MPDLESTQVNLRSEIKTPPESPEVDVLIETMGQAVRRLHERHHLLCSGIVGAFGCTLFLVVALLQTSLFAMLCGIAVFLNGVPTHIAHGLEWQNAYQLRIWDVLCNVVLAITVNYTTRSQPATAVLTLTALVSWRLNQRTRHPLIKSLAHLLAVQLPMLSALCLYE